MSLALAANLRPGDELLSPVGKPYDTLEEVIGIRPSNGSLAEYGITYSQVDLLPDGSFDYDNIEKAIHDKTKLITIQRSKGYQTRPSFSVSQIGELISFVKRIKPDVIVMVDNCYGEFVETIEPSDLGADLAVGSLIKNPGGGLAPIGGYIAGRKDLIENCSYRLTSPGLGKEVGASLGIMQSFYQGLFLAPTVTASALKGAIFAANIYEKLQFPVIPDGQKDRHDIIQAVTFGKPEGVIAFCKGIQAAAPVDSYVTPEPWAMPGYDSDVIMAAGAFVQGSSIELSADGPINPSCPRTTSAPCAALARMSSRPSRSNSHPPLPGNWIIKGTSLLNCLPFLGLENESPGDGRLFHDGLRQVREGGGLRALRPRGRLQVGGASTGRPAQSREKMAADVPSRWKGRSAGHGQDEEVVRPRDQGRRGADEQSAGKINDIR